MKCIECFYFIPFDIPDIERDSIGECSKRHIIPPEPTYGERPNSCGKPLKDTFKMIKNIRIGTIDETITTKYEMRSEMNIKNMDFSFKERQNVKAFLSEYFTRIYLEANR